MNRKSYLIALAVAVLLVGWMLSGLIGGQSESTQTSDTQKNTQALMDVQVMTIQAESVQRYLEAQGESQAEQDVELRAETSGRVVEVLAAEGDQVVAGDVVVRLDQGDRAAREAEAKARVAQREADFAAAQRLQQDGFQSSIAVSEARAALESARAQLAVIEKEIRDTRIRAPIAARVEARAAEVGDYLAVGEEVARLIDTDPLIVVANIAQQDVRSVMLGREVEIALATGDQLTGTIRYISSAADEGSRTFRVEAAAPNSNGLPAGVSATVRIPLESIDAHFLSPAWLSLEDNGQVGVKSVNAEGIVVFHPVEIVRTERDGMWVSGLPSQLRMITVGQGFVRAGEQVNPVPSTLSQPQGNE